MSSGIDSDSTFNEEDSTVLETSSHTGAKLDTNDDEAQVTAIVARLIRSAGGPALTTLIKDPQKQPNKSPSRQWI